MHFDALDTEFTWLVLVIVVAVLAFFPLMDAIAYWTARSRAAESAERRRRKGGRSAGED